MSDNSLLPFHLPAVQRKKIVATVDGGCITSDGGVLLLAAVERQIGIAKTLAALIPDPRFQPMVTHSIEDIVCARVLAIACGYENGEDLDHLRTDPGFKLACGRLPDSGADLCSQLTTPGDDGSAAGQNVSDALRPFYRVLGKSADLA